MEGKNTEIEERYVCVETNKLCVCNLDGALISATIVFYKGCRQKFYHKIIGIIVMN